MLSVSANRRCQPWFCMPGCSWRCQGYVCRVDMTWHELSRSFAHGNIMEHHDIRWKHENRFSKDLTLWIHLIDCILQEKYSSRFATRTTRTQINNGKQIIPSDILYIYIIFFDNLGNIFIPNYIEKKYKFKGIGWTGKEWAYLAQLKPTGIKFGRPWL